MVFYTSRNDRSLTNPNSLWRTFDNFANQFDTFFNEFDRGNQTQERALSTAPATDIEETATHYDLSFDMPGMKKEDLNVEVNGRTLTVSGKRERVVNDSKQHRSEKFFGEYRRSISLPENFKAEEVEASYDNGVLSIRLPKSQLAGAKKIEIGSGLKSDKSLNQGQTH